MNAQKLLEKGAPPAATSGMVLKGPVRPDLIRDELLCEIFSATVSKSPSAIAMVTEEGKLNYAEVDARAEDIARGLVRKGVRPGRVVGLWMPRGPELLIAQIAISKTGAAWLPFDADAPAERIAVCLSDAEAFGILTAPAFATRLATPCPTWTTPILAADTEPQRES
jgi:non-ribosomal peptide synthetase component F